MRIASLSRAQIAGLLITLLAANAVAYGVIYPSRQPAGRVVVGSLPLTLGPWQGKDIRVSRRVFRVLKPDVVIQRAYTNGDQQVQMLVVVGRNRRSIHNPDGCLRVAGWMVHFQEGFTIDLQETRTRWRELRAERGRLAELVWFTYSDGQRFTTNWFEQQWHMAVNHITRRRPIWAQLQVVAPLGRNSETEARATIQEFLRLALPAARQLLLTAQIVPGTPPSPEEQAASQKAAPLPGKSPSAPPAG